MAPGEGRGERAVAVDLAAQSFLAQAESAHLKRLVDETEKELAGKSEELSNLEAQIAEAAEKARQEVRGSTAPPTAPATFRERHLPRAVLRARSPAFAGGVGHSPTGDRSPRGQACGTRVQHTHASSCTRQPRSPPDPPASPLGRRRR